MDEAVESEELVRIWLHDPFWRIAPAVLLGMTLVLFVPGVLIIYGRVFPDLVVFLSGALFILALLQIPLWAVAMSHTRSKEMAPALGVSLLGALLIPLKVREYQLLRASRSALDASSETGTPCLSGILAIFGVAYAINGWCYSALSLLISGAILVLSAIWALLVLNQGHDQLVRRFTENEIGGVRAALILADFEVHHQDETNSTFSRPTRKRHRETITIRRIDDDQFAIITYLSTSPAGHQYPIRYSSQGDWYGPDRILEAAESRLVYDSISSRSAITP